MKSASDAIREVVEVWEMADGLLSAANVGFTPINDGAYFVLLFGQLERAIDGAIGQVCGPTSGLEFRQRLRLLEDYTLRCELAHGRRLGASINLARYAETYLQAIGEIG